MKSQFQMIHHQSASAVEVYKTYMVDKSLVRSLEPEFCIDMSEMPESVCQLILLMCKQLVSLNNTGNVNFSRVNALLFNLRSLLAADATDKPVNPKFEDKDQKLSIANDTNRKNPKLALSKLGDEPNVNVPLLVKSTVTAKD